MSIILNPYRHSVDHIDIVTDGLVLNLDAGNPSSYSGTGTDWYDQSGNSNDGTLINGVGYSSDNDGTLVFDGVDDYVSVIGDYHLLAELTFDIWFKPANTITSTENQSGRLFGKGGNLEIRWDGGVNSGSLGCDLGGTLNLTSVNDTWYNTVWYNIVIQMASSSSALYIQSELDSTGSRGSITNQTATLQIGKSAGGLGAPFAGNISNFKIYNKVLSEEEIQQNFNALRGRYDI